MLRLPGYDIVQELYQSKSSRVFRARYVEREQNLVLKLLDRKATTKGQQARFRREFELTRYLGEVIEGVVQAFDLETIGDYDVMTLEDFGGRSLAALIRGGQWHRSQFYRTAGRLVEVLKDIHAQGIIHKDINPSNILINPYTDELRIIDFGIAANLGDDSAAPVETQMEGTLPYLAPEQTGRMHVPMDPRTDFYALGITFYELVTGQLPFYAEDAGEMVRLHTTKEAVAPSQRDNSVPEEISQLILQMMAKNLDERPEDAYELQAALNALPPGMPDEQAGSFYGVESKLSSLSFTTSPTTQTKHNLWGDMLDYAAVLKSSQAISSELIIEKLVSRLLVVMLENAGAQRGVLVMQKDNEWVLEAEGEGEEVVFLGEIPLDDPANAKRLPCSLVHHVCRHHDEVILEGPESYADYATDPYFSHHQPVSMLCLPILSKGKALGVVYLENRMVRGMFLKEHFEVVRLLSAQAAIALENATLMRSLQDRKDELRRANAGLEQKVAKRTEELRLANASLERRVEESERAQRVLVELARFGPKSYSKRLRQLLQTCAQTLDVERVSYWRLSTDNSCAIREDLYIRSADAHFEETRALTNDDFPDFLDELANMEYLKVDNVVTSDRTKAIAVDYFQQKGISSLLVSAVWLSGKVVGGLSLGHVGPARKWTHTEIDFTTAICQLISLALETDERRRAQKNLRLESEILKFNPNPILRFDQQGRVTYGNPEAHKLYTNLVGRSLNNLLPNIENLDLEECIRHNKVHRTGGYVGDQFFQFEIRGNQDLGVGQVFGFDISDVRRAEEALRKRERELNAVFESSNDAILIAEGDYLYRCNTQAGRIFGFTGTNHILDAELDTLWPAFQPDGRPSSEAWHTNVKVALKSGFCRFDWVCRRREGETFQADILLSTIAINQQDMVLATIRDITERVRAEEDLRLNEERWHYALEGSQDGIWDWHIAKGEIYFSPRYKEMLGYKDHEMPNLVSAWEERVHPEDMDRVQEEIRKTLARETGGFQHTYRMLARDGTTRWILARGKATFDEKGEPIRMSGSHTDFTERNMAATRFRLLFEYSSDAHMVYDHRGMLDCNKATLHAFGVDTLEDLKGIHPHALSPERQPGGQLSSDRGEELEHLARANGHHRFEWMFLTRDGREFLAEVTLTPMLVDNQQAMLAVLHDITEQKRVDRLQNVQNHILEMVSTDTPISVIMDALARDAEAQLAGCRCAIVVRMKGADLPLIAAPTMGDLVSWPAGNAHARNWDMLVPRQGTVITNLAAAPDYAFLDVAAGFRSVWIDVIRGSNNQALGSALIFCKEARSPRFEENEVLAMCARLGGIAVNRYLAERSLLEAREAAQLAGRAKTRFLSSMSHELRTPLNAVIGFSQLMSRDQELLPNHREHLDIILRSSEHLLSIINDVLEMSRIESGALSLNLEHIDLHALLADVEAMFHLKLQRKGLYLTLRRTPEVPRFIRADPGKIRQVLINLLGNAAKFTEEGGVKVIFSAEAELLSTHSHILKVAVTDTGPGISPKEQAHLFHAFVQTERGRETQSGTGLGLAICREFVHCMGGDISLESEPGMGSTIYFTIPVMEVDGKEVASPYVDRRVVGLAGHEEKRILVAEDNNCNRELLLKLLCPIGFQVKTAVNGEEALILVHDWQPHLVLMDMHMPVMDGIEATCRIKAGEAGEPIPVVVALTSGAFAEDRDLFQAAGCDDYIDKPFRESEIFAKIKKHLKVTYNTEPFAPPEKPETIEKRAESSLMRLPDLPESLVEEIERATLLGDLGQLTDLVETVRTIDEAYADLMLDHLDHFAYDALIRLVKGASHDA